MARGLPRVAAGPSLHDHICAQLDLAGRLPDPAASLPDEDRLMAGRIRWVAGGMDGAFGHHGGAGQSADQAVRLADLVVKASMRPTKRNLRKLYDGLSDDSVLDYIDPMIEALTQRGPNRGAVRELGRWLATTASDRGPVKVGIALLGVAGLESNIGVIRALGAHEEFTLYAVVALTNGLPEPDSELWALAVAVDGWGRIHCVERLRGTQDPAIREWILRDGFRNSVLYEYLAYIAATTGGLVDHLNAGEPDRELLTAAGEILEALIQGGPAEDIDDYEGGADAVEAFLAHMRTRAATLGDFHAVSSIRSYLERDHDWVERSHHGWSATRREAFEAACADILARETWDDAIRAGLSSPADGDFWRAEEAARVKGIDTFDLLRERISADPLGGPWYHAWRQADGARAEALVELARRTLPLTEIASGPADEVGMGPSWRPHSALDWTLQAVRDHVGIGADLVVVGLQSPVTRNRNMSLNVLKAWPSSAWPEPARRLAQELARSDPNERAREFAGEVLAEADA